MACESTLGYVGMLAGDRDGAHGPVSDHHPSHPNNVALRLTDEGGSERAVLTDKALYTLGGRIALEEVREVEYDGGMRLKVRGHGRVHRMVGLTDAGELARRLEEVTHADRP